MRIWKLHQEILKKGYSLPYKALIVSSDHIIYTTYSFYGKETQATISNLHEIVPSYSRMDRGRILDIFSKFEFLISQIVFAIMNKIDDVDFFDIQSMQRRDILLDFITIQQKIDIIEKHIGRKLGKIRNLIGVRNNMAHLLNIKYVKYNEKKITDPGCNFRLDMSSERLNLLKIYSLIRDQKKLISIIEDKVLELQ